MITFNNQRDPPHPKKKKKKKKKQQQQLLQFKKQNKITLIQSIVLKNIKNYQPKIKMQEKKIHKKLREREREREPFLWGKTMHRMEEVVTNL